MRISDWSSDVCSSDLMLLRDQRIAQRVVLVIIFDDRARQLGTLLNAQPLDQRSRGDVADHDFDRDDLNLANELLAHIETAYEVRRYEIGRASCRERVCQTG